MPGGSWSKDLLEPATVHFKLLFAAQRGKAEDLGKSRLVVLNRDFFMFFAIRGRLREKTSVLSGF